MSSTPFSQPGFAWTTDRPVVADENSIMCMIQDCLSDVRGRKVHDLQKSPHTNPITVGSTPRARKVMELESKNISNKPVSNDLLIRGGNHKDLKQSCFLPSEKPAAAFLTTLDPVIRKALSASIATDLKTHMSNNPDITTIKEEAINETENENSSSSKVSNENACNICEERTPSLRSSSGSAHSLRSNNCGLHSNSSMLSCSGTAHSLRSDNCVLHSNPSMRSDISVITNKHSVRSYNSVPQRNPSVRSSSGSTTMYPQPMTDYRRKQIQKSMSLNARPTRTVEVERRFSENRYDRRKPCSSDGSKTSSASSSRSGDSLPVFDLRDLETNSDQIDSLLIPGMCNFDEDKKLDRSMSASVKRSNTNEGSDAIEHFIRLRRTNSANFDTTESDSECDDLFTDHCPPSCTCELCQVTQSNNPVGIVQYLHGDVIKTYDWSKTNAKETEL